MPKISKLATTFIRGCIKYYLNIIFYLVVVGVLFYSFWHFFEVVDRPLSFDYMPAVNFNFGTALLLSMLYFVRRHKKGFVFALLAILSIYLVSNALYYRTYYTILPIDSYKMVGNLNGLKDSIMTSFRWTDVYFVLPLLGLYIVYLLLIKKRVVVESKRFRNVGLITVAVVSTIIIGSEFYKARNNPYGLFSSENEFRYDAIEGTSTYGFVACWGWQVSEIFSESQKITPNEVAKIENWLAQHPTDTTTLFENKRQNVILMIVESLESFPIGKKIDHQVITPNLNRLVREKGRIYADRVVPQVKGGRSSDAQLLINTGLLPLRAGAACFRNTNNEYKTLAEALHQKGYSTQTMLGGNASFWNQGVFNKLMGYSDLVAIDRYNYDETYEFGLTDSSFLSQSAKKLAQLPEPYLAQLITLSSHTPFVLIDNRRYLKTPKDCPKQLANYLNAVHYVDECIGRFIDDLKRSGQYQKSMIMITGDHDAFNHKPYLSNKYGKILFEERNYVPFLVLNAPTHKTEKAAMGQIDIFPTLLDLLGLNTYEWHGLGTSILRPNHPQFAIDAKFKFVSLEDKTANAPIQLATQAWEISNLIISKNYFGEKEK